MLRKMGVGIGFDKMDFVNDNVGWIIRYEYNGFLRTEDGGETWHSTFQVPENNTDYYISGINDSVAYVSGYQWNGRPEAFVVKTKNGGEHWKDISPKFQDRQYYEIQLCDNETALNNGNTWIKKIFTFPFKDIVFIDSRRGYASGGYRACYGHGCSYDGDLFSTDDGGATWNHCIKIQP